MKLAKRIAEVYQDRGISGVCRQVQAKAAYWHRRITFRRHVIKKSLGGYTFDVAINNLFVKGSVEDRLDWPELDWIRHHLLEPGDFVVDCGANIGFTTIFFAHFVGPDGRVMAFEPLSSNARDIRQNVKLNRLRNVDIREMAVGGQNGTVTIADTPNGILSSDSQAWNLIAVPIVRLDDMVPIGQPTFIKIDVEGYELEVLSGAQQILAKNPKLDIEVHLMNKEDKLGHCREVFRLIARPSYELFIQRFLDGPIEPFEYSEQILNDLIDEPVFNVFARPIERVHR